MKVIMKKAEEFWIPKKILFKEVMLLQIQIAIYNFAHDILTEISAL